MKKTIRNQLQLTQAKAGLKLFYDESLLITDYQDMQNHLNNLASYFEKYRTEEALNKNLILFKAYLLNESESKKSLKTIRKKTLIKNIKSKSTFKDYLPEYHILKNRGMSYRGIAQHSEKYFKMKVSKDTLRKYLNEGITDAK